MESDMLLLGGMVLAISGFLAFDYKERKPWQKMIFGMLYAFFGTIFVMLAGFMYVGSSDLSSALSVYGTGISFATLGFLAMIEAIARLLAMTAKTLWRLKNEKKEEGEDNSGKVY